MVEINYGGNLNHNLQSHLTPNLRSISYLLSWKHPWQWAREWFEEAYTQTPEDVNRYLNSESYEQFASSLAAQQNMKFDTLTRIKESLVDARPASFSDCVQWARLRFEGTNHPNLRIFATTF